MKRMLQGLFLSAALCAATATAAPYFAFRSQSVNAARELVGQQSFINRPDMDCRYGVFSITPEFTRTFWPGKLAQCMFGNIASCNDCGASIKIAGSAVPDRGTAWLADYFGLPQGFSSTLTFNPLIWNFNIDLNFYFGLDDWAKGMYFRIHAPLTYTKWNLDVCEQCITSTDATWTTGYPQGYFAPNAIANADLNDKALTFFQGGSNVNLGTVDSPDGTQTYDITFHPLAYSKFPSCGCDGLGIFRLSDIEMALGWNFFNNCESDSQIGLEVRVSAPTGNKPCAEYFFYPLVGQGGNWKLGGGLSARTMLWKSCDENASLGFWLWANVQHLFNVCQDRVFDLNCKPNSRYMLAMKMVPQNTGLNYITVGQTDMANYVFAHEYAPVANLTHQSVYVSVPVEGNIVAKLAYTNCNWQWDLGYEFWGRSCEQISRKTNGCTNELDGKTWALKGDAFVYGFQEETSELLAWWYPLSATENEATICSGTNYVTGEVNPGANPNIDYPELAFVNIEGDSIPLYTDDTATTQQRTSIQPVMIKASDVGYNDAQTRGISNKIFTHLSYSWRNDCDVVPFFGVGVSAEFGKTCCKNPCKQDCNDCCSNSCCSNDCNDCNSCDNNCNDCNNCNVTSCDSTCATSCTDCGVNTNCCCQPCALSQWAVWLKGGVAW